MAKKTKKDLNKLAKNIVDNATSEIEEVKKETASEIKSAAAALRRLGGSKGGKAKALSTKRGLK